MVGFLVIGTLSAVLAAELYFIFKKEEAEKECNCGCCHKNEDEVKIVDSQGRECGCGCCHKDEE